jgi:AraC-like DNA-binding protein
MDSNDHQQESQRFQAGRAELVARTAQIIRENGVIQPLPGFYLARLTTPHKPIHSVLKPSFCVIAQGSKEVLLGDSRYQYDPFHYLLTTVALPRFSRILEASEDRPYLSIRLELSPALVGSVMMEVGENATSHAADVRAMDVASLDVNLLDAVLRLVRLIDMPAEIPVMMPLITREIVYRLLMGDQGGRLRHLAVMGGYTPHIARAVQRLYQEFDKPLRIEQLAQELGMSVSGFHHHFKAVTALSPLQFQKRLRLHEARRLMLSEALDAASAAFRVGYHDAAHFNREYKSLFGVPPMRDVQRMRDSVNASHVVSG